MHTASLATGGGLGGVPLPPSRSVNGRHETFQLARRKEARGLKSSWQRTVLVMFLAQLLASLGFSTIFPFLPQYVTELGATGGGSTVFWVAAVYSVQGVAMMIASPICTVAAAGA